VGCTGLKLFAISVSAEPRCLNLESWRKEKSHQCTIPLVWLESHKCEKCSLLCSIPRCSWHSFYGEGGERERGRERERERVGPLGKLLLVSTITVSLGFRFIRPHYHVLCPLQRFQLFLNVSPSSMIGEVWLLLITPPEATEIFSFWELKCQNSSHFYSLEISFKHI
jgi:hypothetical protein